MHFSFQDSNITTLEDPGVFHGVVGTADRCCRLLMVNHGYSYFGMFGMFGSFWPTEFLELHSLKQFHTINMPILMNTLIPMQILKYE